MSTFGEWLQQQRNQRRLTRQEFSERVGCSISMLRKIETDERRPSAQIAELIAGALEIPSAERPTFIKVARGELGVGRLAPCQVRDRARQLEHPVVSPGRQIELAHRRAQKA